MARRFKIAAEEDEPFRTVVERALKKYLDASESNETAANAMGKIQSLLHHDYDMMDMLIDSSATMKAMDSDETPLTKGFDIVLKRLGGLTQTNSTTVNGKKNAFSILQKKAAVNVRYLKVKETEGDSDEGMDLSAQLVIGMYTLLQNEFELGYQDTQQKEQLSGNVEKLKNALCFLERHWKALLHADFPNIPQDAEDNLASSKILLATAGTQRSGNTKKYCWSV